MATSKRNDSGQSGGGSSALGRRRALPTAYRTKRGRLLHGTIEEALERNLRRLQGKVDLILTSPPFPLNRKKKYGNLTGDAYLEWLAALAEPLAKLLTPTGSIVLELGNAWEPKRPTMSLLPMKALIRFAEEGDLNLCQEFVCHNPARLPSPAQWVNVERIRVKDSYTHVWWMAPTENPKANNRNVLTAYGDRMQKLLDRGSYNSGKRPSGFDISPTGFLKNNGGAIPPNVIDADGIDTMESLLTQANTTSNDEYNRYCRENGLARHPARMQPGIPHFFINFLTDPGDLVLDPFGGSNTTGAVAEELDRRWLTIEPDEAYVTSSAARFSTLRKT